MPEQTQATTSRPTDASSTGSGWRIALCGGVSVTRQGRPLPSELPARQGRLVFGYLVLNRAHPVTRDQLMDVLWPDNPPASPEAVLSAVLTRLRRALGDGVLQGGAAELRLELGPDAWVDVEIAAASMAKAQAALAEGDYAVAVRGAQEAAELLEPRLLPEFEGAWLDERRQELEQLRLQSLEVLARAALEREPADLGLAQQAARQLIHHSPYSEAGYGALMRVHAARGDGVEAVRVFDQVRTLLREEMGTTPSPALIALNEQLLRHEVPTKSSAVRKKPQVPLPAPLRAGSQVELIGREAAAETLLAAWQARGGVVFVSGEAGIGKTSLVSRIASVARGEGGVVLYGRCDEEPVGPYQPFAELLTHYLEHADLPELLRRLPREMAELARIVPRLGDPESRAPSDGDRQGLFEAVSAVVRDAAVDQPILAVVDDLHWAERSTLLLLRHVLRGLSDAPVLVVATFRDTEREVQPSLTELLAGLRREGGYERVRLDGLDEEETANLVRAAVGSEPTARFSRRLRDLTAGNPFFITETLRTVQQATPAVAPAVADLGSVGVAEGVRDVLQDRLMRRTEPAIGVLRAAAVAGRRFDLPLIAATLERSPDELLPAFEELIGAGLLVEQPEPDSFAFSHDLVRETQYGELAAARRARLHQRIGLALADRPGAPANELARHFFEARHLLGSERAVGYCLAAARRAAVAFAHEEAIDHYDRALVTMEDRGEERCRVLLELGHQLEQIHEIDRSRAAFAEAAGLAKRAGLPELQAMAATGFARWKRYGLVDQMAIDLLEEALRALPSEPSGLRAETLGRLAARLDQRVGAERARRVFEEALEVARGIEDSEPLARLLPLAPHVLAHPDELELCLSLADEAAALAREGAEPEPRASAQIDRFLALFELGRLAEADAALETYTRLIGDLHHVFFEWQLLTAQASRAVLDGRLDAAERLVSQAAALEREFDPEGLTETWAVQSFMLGRASGQFESIDAAAIGLCAERYPDRPFWEALRGRLHAGLGALPEAQHSLGCCPAPGQVFRHSREWLPTVGLMLETATAVEDEARARELRELAEPYVGRIVVVERASATWGPIADILSSQG